MSRSTLFSQLARSIRIARYCDERGLSTEDGIAEVRRQEEKEHAARLDRRQVLQAAGAAAAAGALYGALRPARALAAPKPKNPPTIGIVGAGFAGLVCADQLRAKGVAATVHDANNRVGGRCYSEVSPLFPGQVIERGGEFIDNLHKTLLGYAIEFGFAKEDFSKEPGAVFYYFGNAAYPESVVVDEYRAFVAAMRADLQTLSGAPTADAHNAGDVTLDYMDLRTYLDTRSAGPVVKAAIIEAYEAEYGLEAHQQSSLNFLLFIHTDKRSRFKPFGVFSDERYHLIGGNQQIPDALAARLPNPVRLGERLVAAKKTSTGQVELTFKKGNQTLTATYDAVVFAIPFTVLRGVTLDPSLNLPAWKTQAIDQLSYGMNAKQMVGFQGAFWKAQGCNGTVYADLPNLQTTWETSPTSATAQHAVLTDYSSGSRALALKSGQLHTHAGNFVADLNKVLPGANTAARRNAQGRVISTLEHWPSNPLSLGSYTCYTPGQFTTLCGNEGKPVGNLFFAGEHANSFYAWQGFMEGAALSGVDAAGQILDAVKQGTLSAP